MSRLIALAAATLLGTATLAAAQPAPGTPPAAQPDAGPGGPAARPQGMEGMRHGDGGMAHEDGDMHPDMQRGMMRRAMMMRGMMRGPRGAHFVFEREGAMINLRCADNENTRACVDAAAVLIDKLAALPAR